MQIPTVFKNGENQISLWIKIVGIVIVLLGAAVGYGQLLGSVGENVKQLDKHEIKLDDHEKRIRDEEKGTARHEELDKRISSTLDKIERQLEKRK